MGAIKDFFLTMLKSLYPEAYKELSGRKVRKTVTYFFALLLFSFVIMALLFLPMIINLPATLDEEFSKFNKLEYRVEQSMKAPILIPDRDPFITIDTTGENEELENGNFLITDKKVQYKPFFSVHEIAVGSVDSGTNVNMLDYKTNLIDFVTWLSILLLPSVLTIFFLLFLVKYAVIILVTTLVSFLVARIAKNTVRLVDIFKICVYASTLMVLVEVISRPFGIGMYLLEMPILFGIGPAIVPLAVYLIYVIIGIALTGRAESHSKK